jgi:hypothetical protein
LESCSHTVCKECIVTDINENFPEVECPEEKCAIKLPEWEIHNIVGLKEFEEL